jgi:hypothetical protein
MVVSPSANGIGGVAITPNYASLWTGVYMFSADVTGPVEENRQKVQTAMGYLASHDPGQFRIGYQMMKERFAANRLAIPKEFNVPSEQVTEELKDQFMGWVLSTRNNIPGPTKENNLMMIVLINLGLGALGTTALYDSLNGDLFSDKSHVFASAGQALGWYLGSFGAATALAAASKTQFVKPLFKPVHFVAERSVTAIAGTRDLITSIPGCAWRVLTGAENPKTRDINLE